MICFRFLKTHTSPSHGKRPATTKRTTWIILRWRLFTWEDWEREQRQWKKWEEKDGKTERIRENKDERMEIRGKEIKKKEENNAYNKNNKTDAFLTLWCLLTLYCFQASPSGHLSSFTNCYCRKVFTKYDKSEQGRQLTKERMTATLNVYNLHASMRVCIFFSVCMYVCLCACVCVKVRMHNFWHEWMALGKH